MKSVKKNVISNVTIIVLIVIVLFLSLFYFKSKSNINNIKQQTQKKYNTKITYDKKYNNLNYNSLKHFYMRHGYNLNQIEVNNSLVIKNALSIAFNNCSNNSKFNHNSKNIKKMLGASVGSAVLNVVKPQINQDEHFQKATSMAQKGLSSHISYGQFNSADNLLPFTITENYKTPPYDINAGGGAHTSHTEKNHYGFMIINGTLNVSNHKMQYNNGNNIISG